MIDLKSMYITELEEYVVQLGEKKFRGTQIFQWLNKGVSSFEEMRNLPQGLITKLKQDCSLTVLDVEKKQISKKDGTVKYLFHLSDHQMVESVLMKYHYGNSICISSQAGCKMGCLFCASAEGGLARNLTAGEMLDQVLRAAKDTGEKINHVVVMGTGEPFDNYQNLLRFLRLLHDEQGMGMSYRNMTVSTCGIPERMIQFAKDMPAVTMAISLHAPSDKIRSQLMPISKKYPYQILLNACKNYLRLTNRRITFEYVMIEGINDQNFHARELAENLKGMLCHVNLIPFNGGYGKAFHATPRKTTERFQKILEENGIEATIRREMGQDIDGACGQLRHISPS